MVKDNRLFVFSCCVGAVLWFFIVMFIEAVEEDVAKDFLVVERVVDGDTFVAESGVAYRLCGIDAPERDTQVGKDAAEFLKRLIEGKQLRCLEVGNGTVCDGRSEKKSYKRVVVQCFMEDGYDVAGVLVSSGHARDWPRFSNGYYSKFIRDL